GVGPVSQSGQEEQRYARRGPRDEVATGELERAPPRPVGERAHVQAGERRDGGQHHRRHHQCPHDDEGGQTQAHRADAVTHVEGAVDGEAPRRCRGQQHDRRLRGGPQLRRRTRLGHAAQEKGAVKPLLPGAPKLTPMADTLELVAGATVRVLAAGWNTLSSTTGGPPSMAVNSLTSTDTSSPIFTL